MIFSSSNSLKIAGTSQSTKGYFLSCISLKVNFQFRHSWKFIFTLHILLSFVVNFTRDTLTFMYTFFLFVGTNLLHLLGSYLCFPLQGSWTCITYFLSEDMLNCMSWARVARSSTDFDLISCKIYSSPWCISWTHIYIIEVSLSLYF